MYHLPFRKHLRNPGLSQRKRSPHATGAANVNALLFFCDSFQCALAGSHTQTSVVLIVVAEGAPVARLVRNAVLALESTEVCNSGPFICITWESMGVSWKNMENVMEPLLHSCTMPWLRGLRPCSMPQFSFSSRSTLQF